MPKFSVVIPLYNKEKFVLDTVNSVLSQTLKDFEVIVVDDCSTDAGVSIVKGIDDERLQVISLPFNSGVAAARNHGVELSRSPWVAFLDADDVWFENHLEELERIIHTEPAAGVVAAQSVQVDSISKYQQSDFKNKKTSVEIIDYFKSASRQIGILHTSSLAIRKDVCIDCGGFENHKNGQDIELWARVCANHICAKSQVVTTMYLQNTGGAMDQMNARTQKKVINSPLDISPSAATVKRLIDNGSYRFTSEKSLSRYFNSRLRSSIKSSFVRKDVDSCIAASRFFLGYKTKIDYVWLCFLKMPRPILYSACHFRFFLKNLYRSMK